jgi:putative ABC transport system substrate-binding protein
VDRRAFLTIAVGCLLAVPLAGRAQQPGRAVRIGLLDAGSSSPAAEARWKALREQLRQLGYVEGQNVVFEARWGDAQPSRLRSLAASLVAAKVDIVVTAGSGAALAAREATTSIPIVTATGGDLVELGLVTSLARPGGNVTGVISLIHTLTSKRMELLKQVIPRASRVAILRDPSNRGSLAALQEAESVAKPLELTVQALDVRASKDLDAAFSSLKRDRVDAVILGENTRFIADRRRIAELAVSNRLPMMTPAREFAEAGGLLSYGTEYLDLFRRAATYVDRILKGARPGDLPVEQPTKFELVINLKTARALSITIPQFLLQSADQVIE